MSIIGFIWPLRFPKGPFYKSLGEFVSKQLAKMSSLNVKFRVF